MYVFDTVLEPKTSLLSDVHLQRLIFRLPHEVMATARRDRRRLLKTPERGESSRPSPGCARQGVLQLQRQDRHQHSGVRRPS